MDVGSGKGALPDHSGMPATTHHTFTYDDCTATWDAAGLEVGNAAIRRRWQIRDGLLVASELTDLIAGRAWLTSPAPHPAPSPSRKLGDHITTSICAAREQETPNSDPALVVRVRASGSATEATTVVRIFPGLAAISLWMETAGGDMPAEQAVTLATGGDERAEAAWRNAPSTAGLGDLLPISHRHRRLGTVSFRDHSDTEDSFVHESIDLLTIPSYYSYLGNLFWIEDQPSGDGVILLAEAPLPQARPCRPTHDLQVRGGELWWRQPHGGRSDGPPHPLTVLAYRGRAHGRREALHRYQRAHRRWRPERDALVWHSIWGDRNRDGRMCETFMQSELDRLSALGMDYLYLIDGWQRGASTNSVAAGGRWAAQWEDARYWEAHPERFPNGLDGLLDQARRRGFRLGMWYNPDSSDDYANWRRDRDHLLGMHRRYGIGWVKFDGVIFTTPLGEKNLHALMQAVVADSNGAVSVEIDITAGRRTGYWSAMAHGILFLENRYSDWAKWWPHCTLRNLWQLAHWIDPRRLRIEFLNPQRNPDRYGDDPLAPAHYGIDHCFAIAAVANPLAWFEATGLDEAQVARLTPAIAAWRRYRDEMQAGLVEPILAEPDGFTWSGFRVHCADGSGHLLLFRGVGTPDHITIDLDDAIGIEPVVGQGRDIALTGGRLGLRIAAAPGFAWLRYRSSLKASC